MAARQRGGRHACGQFFGGEEGFEQRAQFCKARMRVRKCLAKSVLSNIRHFNVGRMMFHRVELQAQIIFFRCGLYRSLLRATSAALGNDSQT